MQKLATEGAPAGTICILNTTATPISSIARYEVSVNDLAYTLGERKSMSKCGFGISTVIVCVVSCSSSGCSRSHDVLLINRFDYDITVKIGDVETQILIPKRNHCLATGFYIPTKGVDTVAYRLDGSIIKTQNFTPGADHSYQDRLLVIEIRP
jgi:hypothetical protein